MRLDGSSFMWRQPCNNQTALLVYYFGRYSKRSLKSYRHASRITSDKSACADLLESGEERYVREISNQLLTNLFLLTSISQEPGSADT